ncbi:MAG: hypothetical protein JWN46_1677, partial [Acidimicrobiales bacterium]|nr:hypothetical protein [Acidimicrobiales bacterium]
AGALPAGVTARAVEAALLDALASC